MNEVLRHIASHRSVRHFTDRLVTDAEVRAAVEAAQMAATSSWIQAYALLQIEEAETRARLRVLTGDQEQVEQAGAFFVLLGDTRRHRLIAERAGAPYASNLEAFLLATIDTTLFAQNLTLAFEALGFGTCYIGGLRTRLPEVDQLLELPNGVYPLFGLCVGEAKDDPGRRPRLPVEAVWMKERYADDEEVLAKIDQHDSVASTYYEQRGLPGRTWSGGTWRKFRAPQREHLASYYASKGARLE